MDLAVAIVCAAIMGRVLVSFLYPAPVVDPTGGFETSGNTGVILPPHEPVPPVQHLDRNRIFGAKSDESTKGAVQEVAPPPLSVDDKPQESSLNLTLAGIVYCDPDPLLSSAIIVNTRLRKPGVYRVGEEVTPEVYVDEIWPFRVILDERGERTFLEWLPDETKKTTQVASMSTPSPPPSTHVPAPVPRTVEVSRDEMTDRLDELLTLQETASIEPYEENGRVVGLQVSNMGDNALAREMGVRDGDVVQSINGVRVTDRAKALEAMNKAASSSMVRVGMLRNGQRTFMTYRMK
jgi:general secretion pathway protein C